ncbi:MAG: hypothetical protein AAF368_10010 [Planctomycetota bacterium]
MPLFERYRDAGVAARADDGAWVLDLTSNLHSADCGAPDGYGTRLTVHVNVEQRPGHCAVESVSIRREPFGFGASERRASLGPELITFLLDSHAVDLGDERLDELTLRSTDGGEALILHRYNFLYFDEVEPGGILRHELWTGEDDEGCCYGGTSVHLARFDQ